MDKMAVWRLPLLFLLLWVVALHARRPPSESNDDDSQSSESSESASRQISPLRVDPGRVGITGYNPRRGHRWGHGVHSQWPGRNKHGANGRMRNGRHRLHHRNPYADREDDEDGGFNFGFRGNRFHRRRGRNRRPSSSEEDDSMEFEDDVQGQRDEQAAAVGGKYSLGLSHLLPDMEDILPHLSGQVRVGPRVNVRWNLGERLGLTDDWWKGPNVCQSEYETESERSHDSEISRHSVVSQTTCDRSFSIHTCTTVISIFGQVRTYVTTYECCHGYQRVAGESGCPEKLDLTDLLSTAVTLNLTQFSEAVGSVGLEGPLTQEDFTVFVPSDEAFDGILPDTSEEEEVLTDDEYDYTVITPEVMEFAKDLDKTLLGHVVMGFLKTHRLQDEEILETVNPKIPIRVNKYEVPKSLVTANCIPVVAADNEATNGVIHVISGVLSPVQDTLLELVGKDPELSTLKTLLAKTGLSGVLDSFPGQFTLFAPTNTAFNSLDTKKLNRLLGSKTCLANVLKQHLVGNVICSSILEGNVRTLSVLGEFLHFNQSDAGVTVEGAAILEVDKMATNGVLHKIDKPLIPKEALGILDLAEKAGATDFLDLVAAAGLTKTLETAENITVFVPSNEAIQSLPPSTLTSLTQDPVALAKVLKYHVTPGLVSGRGLCNGRQLDTLESDKTVTIKDYSSFPFSSRQVTTVQCAPVKQGGANIKACNGIIHILDKVMLPPAGDITDVLSLDSRFSTLVELLKHAGIAGEFQLSGPFTLFAPTNAAFERLPDSVLRELKQASGADNLQRLLQHHVMHDTLCCAGIMKTSFFSNSRERMLDGSTVVLSRNVQDNPTVNDVPIASCDLSATNGIVHAIDSLIPEAIQKYSRNQARSGIRGGRSRFGRVMDHVRGRIKQLDRQEWEFEWPSWTRWG